MPSYDHILSYTLNALLGYIEFFLFFVDQPYTQKYNYDQLMKEKELQPICFPIFIFI